MAAIILKNHLVPTARAALADEVSADIAVFGGIALNHSCSGLNPEAVRVTLALRGKVVWMPTVCADNHLRYVSSQNPDRHVQAITACREDGLSVVGSGARLVDEVGQILDLIAEADAVLATGLSRQKRRSYWSPRLADGASHGSW